MYYIFDCHNNKNLFETIKQRLIDLDYTYSGGSAEENICIQSNSEYRNTMFCSDLEYARRNSQQFTFVPLDDLFCTDKYKYNEPIMIGEYEVKVNKDSITVGCQDISRKKIKKIAELFYTVTEKKV